VFNEHNLLYFGPREKELLVSRLKLTALNFLGALSPPPQSQIPGGSVLTCGGEAQTRTSFCQGTGSSSRGPKYSELLFFKLL